jgi:hypothetical protein
VYVRNLEQQLKRKLSRKVGLLRMDMWTIENIVPLYNLINVVFVPILWHSLEN